MDPAMRMSLFIVACLLTIVALARLTSVPIKDTFTKPHDGYEADFSFGDPVSLFFPSASISLTDDNSTFFSAKPAAFGPPLPSHGLVGQLWIGNGFGEKDFRGHGFFARREGELGCEDVPGFLDDDWASDIPLNPKPSQPTGKTQNTGDGEDVAEPDPSSETDREERTTADINGKIVLISRGVCGFSDKVEWAQNRGAIAVIIGDNIPGGPLVRMYARGDISNISIPSIFTSHTTAHLLSSLMPSPSSPFYWDWDEARFAVGNDEIAAPPSEEERDPSEPDSPDYIDHREGLWVTLTETEMSASPFFNTLFVLVVSPLMTLAVVYSMLLLRSRIRRRRWRAPKSVVERLPVRVYHTLSSQDSPGSETPTDERCTSTTPLLSPSASTGMGARSQPCPPCAMASSLASSSYYGSLEPSSVEKDHMDAGLAEWRRKYRGKQKECVVCLDEYIDGVSRVMSLPCGHEFHADCITPWLTTRRRTCPICKGDVVRSLDRDAEGGPSSPSDETEDDVQIQAAETINSSPSAALPIPYPSLEQRLEAEHAAGSIFSSFGSPPIWSSVRNPRPARGARDGAQNHDRQGRG